jgi:hypothetical protein
MAAPKTGIELWLVGARQRLREMPADHPTRWVLARQIELIAKGIELVRGDGAARH